MRNYGTRVHRCSSTSTLFEQAFYFVISEIDDCPSLLKMIEMIDAHVQLIRCCLYLQFMPMRYKRNQQYHYLAITWIVGQYKSPKLRI